MTEFELKLEIPAPRLRDLLTEFESAPAKTIALRALYLDTADEALARHGVALRLRNENGRWIQTAKGPGERALERLEHEAFVVAAPAHEPPPALDLARHDGTPLGLRIRHALKQATAGLQVRYETDIARRVRVVSAGASTVELALDQGRIVAGERSVPVCELELELKSGEPADVVRLAGAWRSRHALWLSGISKAAKGRRLLRPAVARNPGAKADPTAAVSFDVCVDRLLDRASEVAELPLQPGQPDPDASRQVSALQEAAARVLQLRTTDPADAPLFDALDAAVRAVLVSGDPAAAVREGGFQDVLLSLIERAHATPNAR
jgi:triphosphatase